MRPRQQETNADRDAAYASDRLGCGRIQVLWCAVKEGWFDARLASLVVRIGIMDLTGTGLWC